MLAPNVPSTETSLQSSVTAGQAVTQYSTAVATLIPAYYPALKDAPPSLQPQLEAVVADTSTWSDALCAHFSQTIPQQFIAESGQFSSLTSTMLWAEQQLSANPANDSARTLLENCLDSLLNTARRNSGTLQTLQQQLVAYQNTLQNDHAAITSTLAQLANATPNGPATVQQLTAVLTVDFLDSQQLGPCVAVVEITSSVDVQLTDALGVAPNVVPVALLQALLRCVLSQNETATQAMSAVLETWSTLSAKYASVVADLRQASGPGILPILQQLDVQAARSAWSELAAFARTIGR